MNIYFDKTVWLSQFLKGQREKVFKSVKTWKAVAGVSSSAVWLAFDLWKVTLRGVKLLTVFGTQCNAAKPFVLILASRNTLVENHYLWFTAHLEHVFIRMFSGVWGPERQLQGFHFHLTSEKSPWEGSSFSFFATQCNTAKPVFKQLALNFSILVTKDTAGQNHALWFARVFQAASHFVVSWSCERFVNRLVKLVFTNWVSPLVEVNKAWLEELSGNLAARIYDTQLSQLVS